METTGSTARLGPSELVRTAAIARRYYLDGRSKVELAEEFGLSRFKIARILDDALTQGIVSISITLPTEIDAELSDAVRQRYGLRRAVVISTADDDETALRSHLGRVAAEVLGEVIQEGDVVGFTWGRTLIAMTEHLTHLPRCTTVQLTGVSLFAAGDTGSVEIVRRAAGVSGGAAYPIYAPLMVPDATTAASLRKHPEVAKAMRQYEHLTVAVLTVGSWDPPSSLAYEVWPRSERDRLREQGAVAEICARIIDDQGRHIESESSHRVVAITIDQLRQVPEAVLVSGGRSKRRAVAAALRAGFVTSLVTDAGVARALLDDTAQS